MTLAKIRHLKDGRGKEGRGGAAWKGKESLGLLERAEGGGQCCPCCDREHNRLRLCCCCCCRVAKISSAAVLQTGSLSLCSLPYGGGGGGSDGLLSVGGSLSSLPRSASFSLPFRVRDSTRIFSLWPRKKRGQKRSTFLAKNPRLLIGESFSPEEDHAAQGLSRGPFGAQWYWRKEGRGGKLSFSFRSPDCLGDGSSSVSRTLCCSLEGGGAGRGAAAPGGSRGEQRQRRSTHYTKGERTVPPLRSGILHGKGRTGEGRERWISSSSFSTVNCTVAREATRHPMHRGK